MTARARVVEAELLVAEAVLLDMVGRLARGDGGTIVIHPGPPGKPWTAEELKLRTPQAAMTAHDALPPPDHELHRRIDALARRLARLEIRDRERQDEADAYERRVRETIRWLVDQVPKGNGDG